MEEFSPDPEVILIQTLINKGELKKAVDAGMKPEHFTNTEAAVWYKWLLDYYRDPAHFQAVPSMEVFKLTFQKALLPKYNERLTTEEAIIIARQKQVRHTIRNLGEELFSLPDDHDYHGLIAAASDVNKRLVEVLCRDRQQTISYLSSSADTIISDYKIKKAVGLLGVFWPWALLNEKIGGLEPGNLVVMYGRPKNLKTWMATEVMLNYYLMSFSSRVLLYSCEMPVLTMRRRCAARLARVSYGKYRAGRLSVAEEQRMFEIIQGLERSEQLSCSNGHKKEMAIVYPDEGASVLDLQAKIESYGPDLVVVDGVQYMASGSESSKTDWKAQTDLSRNLKRMAMHYKIPMIAVHQANRVKNSDYDMDDMAFSDSWGRDCDVGIKIEKLRTTEVGNICALLFTGAREFDLTGIYVHAKCADNFSYIDEIKSMDAFDEFVKTNRKKNMEVEKAQRAVYSASKRVVV